GPSVGKAIAFLLNKHAGDSNMMAAIQSSLREENIEDVVSALEPSVLRTQLQIQLAEFAIATNRIAALELVATQVLDESKDRNLTAVEMRLLGTILNAPQVAVIEKLTKDLQNQLRVKQQRFLSIALDPQADLSLRVVAISICGTEPVARPSALLKLFTAQHPLEIQLAALDRIGALDNKGDIILVLAKLDTYSPEMRNRIIDQVIQRQSWHSELLATGKLQQIYNSVDIKRRAQLETIPLFAGKLETPLGTSSRVEVLTLYRSQLLLPSNASAGKQVFLKHCAACHKFGGDGFPVGPDLAALTNKSSENLLVAILDPGRAVETKYLEFTVSLVDGKQHTGMISSESSGSISFVGQNAKSTVVLRRDIDQISTHNKSFMPDGFEKVISPQDMSDLIAYVQTVSIPSKHFSGNAPELVTPNAAGAFELAATKANIYGPSIVFEPGYKNLGFWGHVGDHVVWDLKNDKAGRFTVVLDYACNRDTAGNTIEISVNGKRIDHKIESTDTWENYRQVKLGVIEIPNGKLQLRAQASKSLQGYLLDLRGIVLTPE
ncbi:MAG: putative heme-binding domain-containing protein, partial [Pirellulaceae bacterium]